MPKEWRKNCLISIFKGKGDVKKYGNYRNIKLMNYDL